MENKKYFFESVDFGKSQTYANQKYNAQSFQTTSN